MHEKVIKKQISKRVDDENQNYLLNLDKFDKLEP